MNLGIWGHYLTSNAWFYKPLFVIFIQILFFVCFQLADFSNEYYMLIPPSNYSFKQIKPMNTLEAIDTAQGQLNVVTDLSFSYKVLLGALHRQKGIYEGVVYMNRNILFYEKFSNDLLH